ncbi:hypothetical protein ABZ348_30970 [Streptomyces sp. NPDC005963]|uniref:phage tail protein n=1 Tax=Streptomyces sp. NPDC005963 TaxID=3156721 RepID=UPI003409B93D
MFPDTDRFKSAMEKQLDRIEASAKPVAIQARLDMTGFTKQMLQQIRDINATNRTSDSRKIRFLTMISMAGIRDEIKNAVKALQARADASDKIAFATRLSATDVDLEINQQSLDKMSDQLKEWRDKNSPQKIDLELNWPAGAGAAINARLASLTRPRTVSIIPRLNNAAVAQVAASLAALSGIRVLNNMFTKFGDILKNLDKSVPIIGTLATAIAGLAGWGLSASSNLFALSASLAQIGAVSLTLPGILGGFAVGLGVTIAAFKDLNQVLPEVKVKLAELQNQISAEFWAQAKAPIKELVDVLLPRFAEGFRQTATASGQFFGSFATQLTAALNPAVVDAMFGYLNESIATATTGTDTFAAIIAKLGEVGASYLPDLAGWFVKISENFDAWLTRKGELGLKAEIDEGIQSLKDLGGILYETGGILSGVARAAEAAGGSSLGMMRDTLASIHDVVDSPGFQQGLTEVFTAAHQAMSNIADISGPAVKNLFSELGGLLTSVLPVVGTIIGTALGAISEALAQPAVTEGVKAMFDGLLVAVQALAPAMNPLGQALGALMQVVSAFAAMLGPLVAAALIPLSQAFAQLAPMVTPIITLLGGTLTGVIQQLTPILMTLVPVIGDALGMAFQALGIILPVIASLFTQIMTAVVPLVAQLIAGLAPILPVVATFLTAIVTAAMPLVDILLQLLSAVIMPLIPVIQNIVSAVLPPLAAAFAHLVEAVTPLLDALLAVVNFLMPILAPAIEFVAILIGQSLAAAIDGVAMVFEGAIGIIKGVWEIFAGFFTDDWGRIWDGIKDVFSGIWDVIVGAFKVFLNVGLLGVAGKALKGIKGLWDDIWNGIKSFVVGIWNSIKGGAGVFMAGIRGAIDDGLSAIRGAWTRIWDGIKSFFSDTWTTVKSLATTGMSRLKTAVEDGIRTAVQFIRDLPGKAKSALGDLGSTLASAGRKLIQGFIDGVKNMFGSVKSTLGDLTSKLTDWKGPESLDRVLLVGAGQLVIDGFIRGLESRYGAVRKSLYGLTRDVAGVDFDTPGMGGLGAARGVTSAISSSLAHPEGGGATKVFNYFAAPGSSISSEEDLFSAASRARFGW